MTSLLLLALLAADPAPTDTSAPASAAIPASASGRLSSDAPLRPVVTCSLDGSCLLNADAVRASERDREAWKAQLREAQTFKAATLVAVGAGGLVVGVLVGWLVVPRR